MRFDTAYTTRIHRRAHAHAHRRAVHIFLLSSLSVSLTTYRFRVARAPARTSTPARSSCSAHTAAHRSSRPHTTCAQTPPHSGEVKCSLCVCFSFHFLHTPVFPLYATPLSALVLCCVLYARVCMHVCMCMCVCIPFLSRCCLCAHVFDRLPFAAPISCHVQVSGLLSSLLTLPFICCFSSDTRSFHPSFSGRI